MKNTKLTFAQRAQKINKLFEGRNDVISLRTKEVLLEELMQEQESVREQMGVSKNNTFENGGEVDEDTFDVNEVINNSESFIQSTLNNQDINTDGTSTYDMQDIRSNNTNNTLKTASSGAALGNSIAPGIGAVAGGTIGAGIGIIKGISARKKAMEANDNYTSKNFMLSTNKYKYGGPTDPTNPLSFNVDNEFDDDIKVTPFRMEGKTMSKYYTNSLQQMQSTYNKNDTVSESDKKSNGDDKKSNGDDKKSNGDDKKSNGSNKLFTADNLNTLLRYSPIISDAFQLSNLKKPKYESLNKLNKVYKKQVVDTNKLQTIINNQTNSTNENLANATNGSVGSYRSNLLGMNLNKIKALSNAYSRAEDINNSENRYKQQFDLGISQFNIQQDNKELDINDRNEANYETQKSKLLTSLGNNIGNVGLENVRKKYAEKMWLLYDSNDNYIGRIDKKTGKIVYKEDNKNE